MQWHSQKLCVGAGPWASPLPTSLLPSPSLEVGPLIHLGGLGERCEIPSGSGQSPADKRFWVHFELKTALLVIASLKSIFMQQNASDCFEINVPKSGS